jgi:hypothetical protein
MQRAGDAAPLVVLRVDGALQECLAFRLPLLEPACQPPGQGERGQPQQDEDPDERQRKRLGLAPAALRDRAEARVGLEQQRPAAGPADRQVDLEQLLVVALEAVLGGHQVGDLGVRPPLAQRLAFIGAEREVRPDQPALVGPEDASLSGPDLHAHDRLAQHLLLERRADSAQRRRVAAVEAR